jgi:hypothetical protein
MTPGNRRVRPSTPAGDHDVVAVAPDSVIAPTTRAGVLSLLRAIVGIALVTGTSIGVAWAARRHVLTALRHRFGRRPETSGRRRRSPRRAVLAIIFNVRRGLDAKIAILEDPWIADATLSSRRPGNGSGEGHRAQTRRHVALGDTFLASPDGDPFKKLEPGDPIGPLLVWTSAREPRDDRRAPCAPSAAQSTSRRVEHGA